MLIVTNNGGRKQRGREGETPNREAQEGGMDVIDMGVKTISQASEGAMKIMTEALGTLDLPAKLPVSGKIQLVFGHKMR